VLVINESTSYPGTLRNEIAVVIENASGLGHMYAASPERVDPGNEKWVQKNTPRLLAGLTPEATALARKFYSSFCDQIVEVSSPEVAEAAKLFENTFRQVNIALVNEFAQISNALDIPTQEVLDAAATKPFGFMPFYPGPGLGGHCIPIDPFYLTWKAREYGHATRFIELAGEINTSMPEFVLQKVGEALNSVGKPLRGSKILLLGLAYKPNVDDDRESPSYILIEKLESKGAIVGYHDPYVPEIGSTREHHKLLGRKSVPIDSPCDLVLISTAHSCFRQHDFSKCAAPVVDTRNLVPPGKRPKLYFQA
jgi:UDP-N-acetyl-D-glucosamine dehydrogenase